MVEIVEQQIDIQHRFMSPAGRRVQVDFGHLNYRVLMAWSQSSAPKSVLTKSFDLSRGMEELTVVPIITD